MYLEDKKTLLCAIDHGFSTIKTEHFIFENGVKKLGSEATLQTNTMLYKGSWYKVGEGRLLTDAGSDSQGDGLLQSY